MNRRHVLKSVPIIGGVSIAGCSSIFDSEGTVLGKIKVINSTYVPNRIRISVIRDQENLMDRKIFLPPIDAESGTPGRIIDPLWSDEQAKYTIQAVHIDETGNRETRDWKYTFTQEDYNTYYGDSHEDPGCIGAFVNVGDFDEKENAPIGIGPTYMDDPCRGY